MGNEPSKRTSGSRGGAAAASPSSVRRPPPSQQRGFASTTTTTANNNNNSSSSSTSHYGGSGAAPLRSSSPQARSHMSSSSSSAHDGVTHLRYTSDMAVSPAGVHRSGAFATSTATTTRATAAAAPAPLSHIGSLHDSGIFAATLSPSRGAGGGTQASYSAGGVAAAAATMTTTLQPVVSSSPMPRYMDSSSVLYALAEEHTRASNEPPQQQQQHSRAALQANCYSPPATTSFQLGVSHDCATLSPLLQDGTAGHHSNNNSSAPLSAPRTTSTPLAIRTALGGNSGSGNYNGAAAVSSPTLVMPTYRQSDALMDSMEGSSPMLRSYRHSSFSRPSTFAAATLSAAVGGGGGHAAPMHPASPCVAVPRASNAAAAGGAYAWVTQTPPTRALSLTTGGMAGVGNGKNSSSGGGSAAAAAVASSPGTFPFGIAAASSLRPSSTLSGALQPSGSGAHGGAAGNSSGGGATGNNATSSSAAASGVGGGMASSQSSHALLAAAAAASSSSSKAPRHARYVEITSYPLGMENYGNTCYCNAVVQLLYHCTPLRLRLLELNEVYEAKKGGVGFEEGTVLAHLCHLMSLIHKSNNGHKERRAAQSIAPLALLQCVRGKNAVFRGNDHQDAHEFAMFVLNDILETERRIMGDARNRALFSETRMKRNSFAFWRSSRKSNNNNNSSSNSSHRRGSSSEAAGGASPMSASSSLLMTQLHGEAAGAGGEYGAADAAMTPLQAILQGQFGSLTACLECGAVSSRREVFLDVNLDTRPGSSLLRCLRHFADPEFFYADNKVRCDGCARAVRAAKTIHICQLPQYALLIHLKRFRYDAAAGTFNKTAHHVALPMEMDIEEYETDMHDGQAHSGGGDDDDGNGSHSRQHDTAATADDGDDETPPVLSEAVSRRLRGVARHKARFTLTGFVAHLGEGADEGHYFTCIRYSPQLWRRFDDETVTSMTEREVQQMFGVPIAVNAATTTTAYILLYERVA